MLRTRPIFLLFLLLTAIVANAQTQHKRATTKPITREDAYRINNLGVALLEQYKYREGADEFRRALTEVPDLWLARVNLAIALYNVPDLDAAQTAAETAAKARPDAPQPQYLLGLIAKSQSRADDALNFFQRVLAIDPDDVGANVNAGQLYAQQRKYAEAATAFRRALVGEPYNTSALYGLGQALLRLGERSEGQTVMQNFQKFRQSGAGTSLSTTYLEQGRYAEGIASNGAEPDLVNKKPPPVAFVNNPSLFLPKSTDWHGFRAPTFLGQSLDLSQKPIFYDLRTFYSNTATVLDADNDGTLDLYLAAGGKQNLRKRDRLMRWNDVSAGDLEKTESYRFGAVAGDYDNDGQTDLFVLEEGAPKLYRNTGAGNFKDVTTEAKIPAYPYFSISCAFVDIDHDGDLDIFIAGLADLSVTPDKKPAIFPTDFAPAPNMLLRNNGDGSFTDISDTAQINVKKSHAIAVVPTDFDNKRDVDLLLVNYDDAPTLLQNKRDGSFSQATEKAGLNRTGKWSCVAAGDFNKDSWVDFYLGQSDGAGVLAINQGQGKFKFQDAPAVLSKTTAAQFVDYDNDGLLDLVAVNDKGLQVVRNVGDSWQSVPSAVKFSKIPLAAVNNSRYLLAADFDNDGDLDLLARETTGFFLWARNGGGSLNQSVRVDVRGRVGNRSGIGAKIDLRAGSLGQKLEYYAASPAPAPSEIIFGLGQRKTADAVRIVWPSGIVQAETTGLTQLARKPLTVTELDLKPSSCPFLYTWNGQKFEFITDFMGGGEMGNWQGPGTYSYPDPDEYVRIAGDKLQPRNGRYEIRVTNELEEVLFVDRLQLVAIDHPDGTEVFPNEGLGNPTGPAFILYPTTDARAVLRATDEAGRDVTTKVAHADRDFVDTFALRDIRGYAAEHSLTLTLPPRKSKTDKELLLLNGWTDYAFSSDNLAASQRGWQLFVPRLEVQDSEGNWRTASSSIGFPVGRPQTVTVDLSDKFLSESRAVRLVTNMRIYWDSIQLATVADDVAPKITRLEATSAELRGRGYSAMVSPDGREPFGYDYAQAGAVRSWKTFAGRYTRWGEVRELLTGTDDQYIISRTGDEIALEFPAMPPARDGWQRTFLFYAYGYSKEMDINSGSPNVVWPLPFRGMSKYPYDWPEQYPQTPENQAIIERYQTRLVRDEIAGLR